MTIKYLCITNTYTSIKNLIKMLLLINLDRLEIEYNAGNFVALRIAIESTDMYTYIYNLRVTC